MLVGKFFTKRSVNMDAVAKTFRPLWRARQNFHIRDAGNNHLVFTFEFDANMEKVLLGEPWTFDRHLVVFQRYDGKSSMDELDFGCSKFWVQIHHLPFSHLTPEIAMDIGRTLGTVVLSEDTSDMIRGNFIRMRVIIDISQPLCRGRQVSFDDGSEGWISFKYERLANVCYWCGRLTHDEKDCIMWLQSKGSLKVENQQFGQWLRASQITSLKKMVIDVKGYGEDWVVRPDAVQTSRQSVLVVQDQPSASVVTAIVSEEGNQNKHFPEELPMTITGGGGQKSVNFEHSRNSNLAKPTPDFEEQLQQIDKALSVDCVSPILSAENPNVVGVKSHTGSG